MPKTNYSFILMLICTIVICFKIVSGAITVSKALDIKINEQAKVNYRLTYSEEQWVGLDEVRDGWQTLFKKEDDSEGSLFNLINTLDIEKSGLDVDTSRLAKANTKIVNHNGVDIGLSKTCITNSNGSFDVQGESISGLVKGLSSLESRVDISFTKSEIFNRGGMPVLKMYDFCVLKRV